MQSCGKEVLLIREVSGQIQDFRKLTEIMLLIYLGLGLVYIEYIIQDEICEKVTNWTNVVSTYN